MCYDDDHRLLDFASLTPADLRTHSGMQRILETIESRSHGSQHHRKFIRSQAGSLAATRSPTIVQESLDISSGFTTEADQPDDEDVSFEAAPCYVFSLRPDAYPFQPESGYVFGTGDLERFPENAGVDLLLPPSNLEEPLLSFNNSIIYSRQGYFAFDSSKHSQFWLHARHKGIRVDDKPLAPKSKILLPNRARVSIGPYRYIFEFKVTDETAFQATKKQFLADRCNGGEPFESTSATPSSSDIRIQDWLLRGIVGTSPVTVIHAATHIRSGEVVAVKRLQFGAVKRTAEEEVELYDAIASSIRGHCYSSFVMQKHSVLFNDQPYTTIREVYLLWKPLARGDFSQFGLLGRWHTQSQVLKKLVFVQILLGLSALHDRGWIHRDLKPSNLGIVDLGDSPFAVIMDEAQAIRQSRGGQQPRVAHCGTVGYLAPELENSTYSQTYGKEVDIWSMGAVAVFMLILGRIPWSRKFNMFVPELDAQDSSLEVFRDFRKDLLKAPKHSLEWLVGSMLYENPRQRPTLAQILSHVSLRDVHAEIDVKLESNKQAGMKRTEPPR